MNLLRCWKVFSPSLSQRISYYIVHNQYIASRGYFARIAILAHNVANANCPLQSLGFGSHHGQKCPQGWAGDHADLRQMREALSKAELAARPSEGLQRIARDDNPSPNLTPSASIQYAIAICRPNRRPANVNELTQWQGVVFHGKSAGTFQAVGRSFLPDPRSSILVGLRNNGPRPWHTYVPLIIFKEAGRGGSPFMGLDATARAASASAMGA